MSEEQGLALLQRVAVRIVARWADRSGCARPVTASHPGALGRHVDLSCGQPVLRVKVKADPYAGTDPLLVADRTRPFYRERTDDLALESVADAEHRTPGWALESDADELWYYRLAIDADEAEVRALMREPDVVFFDELAVRDDDLTVIPMSALNVWFAANHESYTPRPVMVGGTATWHRLVPMSDVMRAVPGVRVVGPVFAALRG